MKILNKHWKNNKNKKMNKIRHKIANKTVMKILNKDWKNNKNNKIVVKLSNRLYV